MNTLDTKRELIHFRCSECDTPVSVARRYAAEKGRCPSCRRVVSIPATDGDKQLIAFFLRFRERCKTNPNYGDLLGISLPCPACERTISLNDGCLTHNHPVYRVRCVHCGNLLREESIQEDTWPRLLPTLAAANSLLDREDRSGKIIAVPGCSWLLIGGVGGFIYAYEAGWHWLVALFVALLVAVIGFAILALPFSIVGQRRARTALSELARENGYSVDEALELLKYLRLERHFSKELATEIKSLHGKPYSSDIATHVGEAAITATLNVLLPEILKLPAGATEQHRQKLNECLEIVNGIKLGWGNEFVEAAKRTLDYADRLLTARERMYDVLDKMSQAIGDVDLSIEHGRLPVEQADDGQLLNTLDELAALVQHLAPSGNLVEGSMLTLLKAQATALAHLPNVMGTADEKRNLLDTSRQTVQSAAATLGEDHQGITILRTMLTLAEKIAT